jgi:argininosuccinate lyase
MFNLLKSLILILLCTSYASAQSVPVEDVSQNLLSWTKHLNSDIDKFYTRDKADELVLSLSGFKQALTLYTKTRKNLSDSIFRNNIAPGKKDPQNVELLRTQMGEVIRQMRNVTDLTNNESRAEGDRLNDQIFNVLNSDGKQFLSYLEAFLNGLSVTKKEIALDNGMTYDRLQQSISLLNSAENKVRGKMR